MIHWTRLLLWAMLLGVGVLAGVVVKLPYEQATNLIFFLVGLGVGIAGIVATFWAGHREDARRLDNLVALIQQMHDDVHELRTLTRDAWGPAMGRIFGSGPNMPELR